MSEQIAMDLPASPWAGYQSRYAAYCRAHGASSPEEMLARDDAAWPGGVMTGYICWIGERWREWGRLTGRGAYSEQDHRDFDAWLAVREGEGQDHPLERNRE